MSWITLGTVQPGLEWQAVGGADSILIDLETVLIRVTHTFASIPRGTAYLRQYFVDENASFNFYSLYPSAEKKIFRISVPNELRSNGIARWEPQIRLRRFKRVPSASNWTITLEARSLPVINPSQQPTNDPIFANQLPNGLDDIP